MGGACCVAARDKNIVSGPSSDILHRNIRHSPSWSFRWDNRGRVAGEETSVTWFSDANNRNQGPNIKYSSGPASGDGSPLDSFQRCTWPKSPSSEGTAAAFRRTPASDRSVSRNVSLDSSLEQVKELTESPGISDPSPMTLSLSLPSTSSVTSPVSSQNHLRPAHSTTTTPSWPHQSSSRFSDAKSSSNSLLVPEERPNESTRGSHGGSSDGWSMHAFSELMATSHREKWSSFDNDSLTRSSDGISMSSSVDLQTCGVCSKPLTEKSLWSSQKLVMSNELSVVSVLICGHVYHAECLEILTPEISKYDPCCPVCTLGEKQIRKLSQKAAFKAESDLKAKNKRSRNRIVDSDLDVVDSVVLDRMKSSTHEGKGPKMASSSSMKSSSLTKPFLKRHFSFGSKVSKSMGESNTMKKKGFFWTRSLKV